MKSLFSHPVLSKSHNLGAVNSINWARILAQIVYYFHSYFSLLRSLPSGAPTPRIRYVVPTGNFGDVLAGYFAQRMGLPIDRLVISTNSNDILDRFFKTGRYEKKPVSPEGGAHGGIPADSSGVKETLSPAMDILVSSNFERLLWYLALECEAGGSNHAKAGEVVKGWMDDLKSVGTTVVSDSVIAAARRDFSSERVSDEDTVATIKQIFTTPPSAPYVLDPHTAVGVAAALRLVAQTKQKGEENVHYISLSTAHPAKFNHAVDLALAGVNNYDFEAHVRPTEFIGLESRERRVREVEKADVELVRSVVVEELERE